jgi:hypothetical protein
MSLELRWNGLEGLSLILLLLWRVISLELFVPLGPVAGVKVVGRGGAGRFKGHRGRLRNGRCLQDLLRVRVIFVMILSPQEP